MNVFVKNTKKYQLIYKAFNPKRHSRAFKIILSILIIQKATFFFSCRYQFFNRFSHTKVPWKIVLRPLCTAYTNGPID